MVRDKTWDFKTYFFPVPSFLTLRLHMYVVGLIRKTLFSNKVYDKLWNSYRRVKWISFSVLQMLRIIPGCPKWGLKVMQWLYWRIINDDVLFCGDLIKIWCEIIKTTWVLSRHVVDDSRPSSWSRQTRSFRSRLTESRTGYRTFPEQSTVSVPRFSFPENDRWET